MNLLGSAPGDGSGGNPTQALGRVVAPGAGTTLVQVSNVTPGTYRVRAIVGFDSGVPAPAAETRNFSLFKSDPTNSVALFAYPIPGTAVRIDQFEHLVQIVSPAGASIGISTPGAATAGVGYVAEMTLEKIRGS